MPGHISAEQRAQYDRDGICFPIRVTSEAEAAGLRAKLEAAEHSLGGAITGIRRHKSYLLWPWLSDLARHPAILDAVEDIVGPDILIWSCNLFIKNAHDPSFVSWHQDSTYWGLSEPTALTAWVALSPSTPESGCMRVSPGTQNSDELPHIDTPDAYNLLTRGQEVQVKVDPSNAIDVVLAPGEMSLHHVRAVHGSEPNRSGDRRIGIAFRYIPTRVQQRAGRDFATLVRGTDRFHHFEPEPVPKFDLDPEAVAAHAEIMRVVTDTLMAGSTRKDLRLNNMAYRIAVDIGGTFTDLAILLPNGALATHKLPSTPADYAEAATAGIRALCGKLGIAPGEIAEVLHGCTVATNVIIEKKGARCALLTTMGFRDLLELRRVRVPRLYDPLYERPVPLIPRDRRFEVAERIGGKGEVVTKLTDEAMHAAIDRVEQAGDIEAVAVCFLNSYANAAHERRAGELLRQRLPRCFITLSVDLLPQIREYERTSTTVVNAYVGPPVARYIDTMAEGLAAAGVRGRLMIMQSSGGLIGAATASAKPARIECGPAAGVIGAARLGPVAGYRNVISFDMGGTTAKASLIEDGRVLAAEEYEVGGTMSLSSKLVRDSGYVLKLPAIDIAEVGAGGGSIVWLDRAGAIKVGPHSAGAVPGPACYPEGGGDPTVTDANVILGFLNPTALAGGSVKIDAARARDAVATRIAGPLGRGLLETAWGIHSIANTTMMRAVKSVTTYRGRDPRDFTLFAFGGNGGVHGVELARALNIGRVVVPPAAGVFSALGLLFAPVELALSQALRMPVASADPAALAEAYEAVEVELARQIEAPKSSLKFRRSAELRYLGQAYELMVEAPEGSIDAAWIAAMGAGFEAEHERSYGRRNSVARGVEFVTLHVRGILGEAPVASPGRQTETEKPEGTRSVYFGPKHGSRDTPVRPRSALSETPRPGPVIIEEYEGTIVIPPDCRAWRDAHGHVVIELDFPS